MSQLLDQVIANTSTGPQVVSEQHDAGQINWVEGMTDPGEMIGCGMYQQLRRNAGESDGAYQTRLIRLLAELPVGVRTKIERTMKAAALRREGLDVSNGRVNLMVAGEPAWHRLGVNIAEATDSANAIRLSGLDWQVEKMPLFFTDATGTSRPATGVFAAVRQDTHEMLGTLGPVAQPIQNAKGFEFLDAVMGEFGAKYETAGSIYGGKRVWMQVKLPNQSFALHGVDQVDAYAMFTNPHDGSGAAYCFPTTKRAVCANTHRVAMSDADKGIRIPHMGDLNGKIEAAKVAIGLSVQAMDQFKDAAEVLSATQLLDPKPYFHGVLDFVLDLTEADAKKETDVWAAVMLATEADRAMEEKKFERAAKERSVTLEDLLERYESETCGINGMRGTAWAAFNAVTESADHGKLGGRNIGSETRRASRRFEQTFGGAIDDVKQVAYRRAVALAA